MSKEHEYITGAILGLLIVLISFSSLISMPFEALGALIALMGGAGGWLFRGRVNGMAK